MARCKQPSYSRNNTSTPYPLRPRGPAALQHQEPVVHIGNCDVRRGRTPPPDDCAQTSVTCRKTQSSITKYVPDTERSPHPRHLPTSRGPTPLERAEQQARHAEDTPSGLRTASQEQPSARAAHPRGSASQGHLTHTHASVGATTPHMSGPPAVRPSAYAPGEVPTLRTRRPPFPFPGVSESAAPQPRESPPLWRNVGPILGSVRRLTEGLPKTLWAIPMGLLDPTSNMWGVRHHDSPPVSEWCS